MNLTYKLSLIIKNGGNTFLTKMTLILFSQLLKLLKNKHGKIIVYIPLEEYHTDDNWT